MNHPEYDKRSPFPKKQPKGICRGCRRPITEPRRQTWCSTPCKKKFDPFWVKIAVWNRDEGKCQMCGQPCFRRRDYHYDRFKTWEENRAILSSLRKMRAEYDHIVPHSEGGLYVVENIRLLCHACHAKRTTEWRRERSKAKKILQNQQPKTGKDEKFSAHESPENIG